MIKNVTLQMITLPMITVQKISVQKAALHENDERSMSRITPPLGRTRQHADLQELLAAEGVLEGTGP